MPRTALLVVDMLNRYDFEDAESLAASAADAVPRIAELADRARDAGVPVVYVNDNWGQWRSSQDDIVADALEHRRELVEPIVPRDDDLFVLKARHSAFYETPLEYLLRTLDAERLVISGQATEQCVLYSALDAYVRHFEVAVPPDATAHIHRELAEAAVAMMERNMRADVTAAADVRF